MRVVSSFVTVMALTLLPVFSSAELDTGLRKLKQEMDREELIKLEQKAKGGDPRDYFELSLRYRQGTGTTPDLAKSMEWLRKAADKGHTDAQFRLGYNYLSGNGVKRSIGTALDLLAKAANKGHANAQFYLGSMCETGEGLKGPDQVQAAAWYKLAAERGHSEAQFRLGRRYLTGSGVAKNEAEARRWLKTAAAKGSVLAKGELERLSASLDEKKPSSSAK